MGVVQCLINSETSTFHCNVRIEMNLQVMCFELGANLAKNSRDLVDPCLTERHVHAHGRNDKTTTGHTPQSLCRPCPSWLRPKLQAVQNIRSCNCDCERRLVSSFHSHGRKTQKFAELAFLWGNQTSLTQHPRLPSGWPHFRHWHHLDRRPKWESIFRLCSGVFQTLRLLIWLF